MKRPAQHVTDTVACRAFESCLPPEWVTREQASDYGADYEVEVFLEGESTGLTFKVQVKGTERLSRLGCGTVASFRMRLDRVGYLVEELNVPTLLVLVDVVGEPTVYWSAVQLDEVLAESLVAARDADQESLTLHVPLRNLLPGTEGELLEAVGRANVVLGTRRITQATATEFVRAVSESPLDSDDTIAELQQQVDRLRLDQVDRLRRSGRTVEAMTLARSTADSPGSNPLLRFAALQQVELIQLRQVEAGLDRATALEQGILLGEEFVRVSAQGDETLRAFAQLALSTAQLARLVEDDFALFLNIQMQQARPRGDEWLPALQHQQRVLVARISGLYEACVHALSILAGARVASVAFFPQAAFKLVAASTVFVMRLRFAGQDDEANQMRATLEQAIEYGLEIAQAIESAEAVGLLASGYLMLADYRHEEEVEVRRSAAVQLASAALVSAERLPEIEGELDHYVEIFRNLRCAAEPSPSDRHAAHVRIIRDMAFAHGIDLRDPRSVEAQFVQVGIADLDPSESLRSCRHLMVHKSSLTTRVAQLLDLPTAAPKVLRCVAHGGTLEGLSLAELKTEFQALHCDSCPDASPHSPGWCWSEEWQEQQAERLRSSTD